MVKITKSGLFSLFILLFAITMLWATLSFQSGTSNVPQMITICLIALSLIQTLGDFFPGFKKKLKFLDRQKDNKDDQEDTASSNFYRNHLSFSLWITIFTLLIYYINVLPAIGISLLLYLKVISKETWRMSILYSVIFTFCIYLIFVVGLGVNYFI